MSCLSNSKGYYIHIGVGFEVAYLSELGKFDGLKSEIGNEYGSHASLYLWQMEQEPKTILIGDHKSKVRPQGD